MVGRGRAAAVRVGGSAEDDDRSPVEDVARALLVDGSHDDPQVRRAQARPEVSHAQDFDARHDGVFFAYRTGVVTAMPAADGEQA